MDVVTSLSEFDLERLLFRRQFLLGPREYRPNTYWESLNLHNNLVLSVHCDLPHYTKQVGNNHILLLGIALDPRNPGLDENDILETLISGNDNIKSLIEKTWPLSGRWLIILQNSENTYLFSDPFGFRSIYYHIEGGNQWCASQPELIKTQCDLKLTRDDNFLKFQHSTDFSRMESPNFGSSTIYQSCYHLLPNHYLDMKLALPIRFYPNANPTHQKPRQTVIEESAELLQGTFKAVAKHHEIALALTSGWDSRLLLAASREVREKIHYFVDRKGILSEDHPDIWVPKSLAEKFGVRFEIRSSELELPGWFVSLLSHNVTGARVLPKSRMFYAKYLDRDQRIYLNGNGGEIFRNYYDKTCQFGPEDLDAERILGLIGFQQDNRFVKEEINSWIKDIDLCPPLETNILDYFYWEQRIGNWGAQFPSEQDIAVEELSPFNCRLLIDNLLSTSKEDRAAPKYPIIQEIIRKLWPEVLELPINPKAISKSPQSLLDKLRSLVAKTRPPR